MILYILYLVIYNIAIIKPFYYYIILINNRIHNNSTIISIILTINIIFSKI